MSDTTTIPSQPPPYGGGGNISPPPTSTIPTTPEKDRLIASARSLPDLVAKAQVLDPALAAQLTPKALIASKSVYGPAASLVVSWAVTRWGLGWDENTCAIVSGVLVLAASAGFRLITKSPIGGLFSAKAAPKPTPSP